MLAKRLNCDCLGWQLSLSTGHLIFVCLAVGLCLLLSLWQWQRAQDAKLRYQSYLNRAAQAETVLSSKAVYDFQQVKTTGHIKRLFLLDNQVHDGIVGWHVLAWLDTESGPVLVNLGWQPARKSEPKLTDFPDPIPISGLAKRPETGFMLGDALADPAWPGIMQQIDITLLRQTFGTELAPFVIYVRQAYGELIPIKPVPENKYPMHMGYVVQWLLIGLAGMIIFIFASRRNRDESQ